MKKIMLILLVFCVFSTGCQKKSILKSSNIYNNLDEYKYSNNQISSINNSVNIGNSYISFKNESDTNSEYTSENIIKNNYVDDSIDDIVEIRERMFLSEINDIYLNSDEYIGKKIKYEGYFATFYNESTEENYYFVIRNGPGCCGNDSHVGFEIQWNDDIPMENQWLEVTGILEIYEKNDYKYLRLLLKSFKILDIRGNDTVIH